jgi:hypothetical protein
MTHDASVVLISETWWSDLSATSITGFNLFKSDRDGSMWWSMHLH